ncbi:hypothetical protein [Corynebacterium deserti]|uniref:hypothetical protein n=1 Tax=Corynebacterium deserti TaxID=1408191 RepID=UPI0012E2394A|nr:hypothetical protein [Corynebacterium deserti]
MEISLPGVRDDGSIQRHAEILIMDAIKEFDPSGQLPPAEDAFYVVSATASQHGVERKSMRIIYTNADDPDTIGTPQNTTIFGLDLKDIWKMIPAQSWPASWWRATPYERTSDESGLIYPEPWNMAKIQIANRTLFTFKHGQAGFVIRRLAQEALDAAMMTQQDPDGTRWVDDPYHVVEVPEEDNSPIISLEARDGSLWDTCIGQAQNAGLILGARLWWPGDPPVRSWQLANSSMTPEQVDITPSQGEPYRQIMEQTFPHAMTVLTVKEV